MSDLFKSIIVDQEHQKERLDKFLSNQFDDLSRTIIQNLIEEDDVLVNQKSVKSSYKLKVNDLIEIFEFSLPSKDILPSNIPLDIVYEDDDVLVVNKVSGMVVHPAPGHYSDTLVNALMYHIDSLSDGSQASRPGIIHRIDKDTSGLLMVAKNNYAHEILAKELQEKKTKREYIALVSGVIKNKKGLINAPVGRDPSNRLRMNVVASGKNAVTHFEVLEQFKDCTLIECRLETGRTHQIRVHMKYINHPLVNDELYGEKIDDFGQYLHAKTLGFTHPRTKVWMEFDSELPIEFKNYIEKLRD
ncbi:MAG: RluA family pseudouridine synthase [Candidatus Izemoplasmatales bacterium]|uniref:Pseudouridine synthase n=1 Tax=Hujiaoplasma nucleasis TaxID=2725268 RepID=A0A7L6N2C8_9MOLU|nr:RluA family pseudouridine synthase [Hujiaoplasma nucleasis]QLY39602.1 RluA family pseudouridine synthase [Hujiaoplasma nucleasis]